MPRCRSFVVYIVEAPVVVVVSRNDIPREIIGHNFRLVQFRHIRISNFVPVPQQHVHAVVVPDELGQFISEGILVLLTFVDPVALVGN